ncbi:DNA-protecting protein DprA, partial [Candidatus Nomurabacteria bacterium CG10_big_fil_rev_8_21_14_0_10_03_31_7]
MKIRKLLKKEFPAALLEIPQPPEDLWIIGDLPTDKNLIYLCVVGSRKFTSYG